MIHKQLRRCCIVNYFGTSCIFLLHCHRVTCWGGKPAPSPEGGLGHSSFLSGKGTQQLISPFVMSSLLTFSVCLGQLLWFKAKWLIKQTNFSGTLYTRRQSHEEVCVFTLPILSLSSYVRLHFLKQRKNGKPFEICTHLEKTEQCLTKIFSTGRKMDAPNTGREGMSSFRGRRGWRFCCCHFLCSVSSHLAENSGIYQVLKNWMCRTHWPRNRVSFLLLL